MSDLIGFPSWRYRIVRGLLLTTAIYSLIFWGYLVVRIVINHASFNAPFIDSFLPWFTFLRLGIITFVLSAGSALLYFTMFWKGGMR